MRSVRGFHSRCGEARSAGYILVLMLGSLIIGVSSPAAMITVSTTTDAGPGSLRQAILNAGPEDTIDFGVTGTIALTSGELTIGNDLTIQGPGAGSLTLDGGGASRIFNVTNGLVTIDGLTLTRGTANGQPGGAVRNTGHLTLSNCTISDSTIANDVPGAGGGAISNANTLTLVDSTVSGSTSIWGGGGVDNTGTMSAADSLFLNNGSGLTGGAITNSGSLLVTGSTFSGNHSDGSGSNGGALFTDGGTVSVINSTFSGNSATFRASGGAIAAFGGTVTILDSTIAGNQCTGPGGTGTGCGVEAVPQGQLSITLGNTIIANNTGGPNCFGSFTSTSHDISSDSSCFDGGTDLVNTDPMLGPLQDNGGPTPTMALLPGSPAINAGDNASVAPGITTDQRGRDRVAPAGGTVDIGAFEFQHSTTVMNSSDSGDGSLRQAIADARPNDVILIDSSLAGGTITLTSGELVIDKDLEIAGPGTPGITISGGNTSRVFHINSNATVTLTRLTITQGNGAMFLTSLEPQVLDGGGILNEATLNLLDCVLTGNSANGGGGLLNTITGSATIRQCTISNNQVVANGGGISNDGTMTVDGSVFSSNSAALGGGGGIFNSASGKLALNFSSLTGNSGDAGPGLDNQGTATVFGCTFSGQVLTGTGSAVLDNLGSLGLFDSTIAGNPGAGGLLNEGDGSAQIVNCTLANNTAAGAGGGIDNAGQIPLMANTLLANNQPTNCSGTRPASEKSDLSTDSSCFAPATPPGQPDINGNLVVTDPKLGPLQGEGGPIQTMALLPGSPAIDAGDNSAVNSDPFAGAEPFDYLTDQRGEQRISPSGGTVDIGAFEVQVMPPPIVMPLTITPTDVMLTVREAQQFSANKTVTWSTPTEGTIDTNGTYVAPARIDSAHSITVIATDAAGLSAQATVHLVPPPPLLIQPSGDSVTLQDGQAQPFTVTPAVPVQWSVTGDGTIDANGLYVAPAEVLRDEPVTLTVAAADGSGRTAATTLHLHPAPLAVSPTSADLTTDEPQTFTANRTVTWSVDDPAGEIHAVDAAGQPVTGASTQALYVHHGAVPPGTLLTISLTATDSAGRTAQATIHLFVRYDITPATATLLGGQSVMLQLSPSAPLTWSVQGDGTVAPLMGAAVTYTAPDPIEQDHDVTLSAVSADGRAIPITLHLKTDAMPGDVNGDGQVGIDDALLALQAAVMQAVAGADGLRGWQLRAAHGGASGGITIGDVILILQQAIGVANAPMSPPTNPPANTP